MEWVQQGLLFESVCIMSTLHYVFEKTGRLKGDIYPVTYGFPMSLSIQASSLMDEIKVISTTKPHSLTDAMRCDDRRINLVTDVNIVKSRSRLSAFTVVFLIVLVILLYKPLVLLSLIVSDLTITRLRTHVRNSFR